MPGLYSSISNDQDIVFADNADFSGADIPSQANGLQDDGQLWIGRTTVPVGETHVVVGNITSSSLTVDFSDPNITIETNGGGAPVEEFILQSGTTPVVPNASGQVGFIGGIDVAGTNPIRSYGVSASQMAVVAQMSQAIAATDPTKIGLCNFDSADFTVDANGFVALAGGGAGQTITGDSGGALSPTAGNWNVLGRSGSKTRGSGSTITVDSPPFSQVGGSGTSVLNSGEFVTATATRTLPATAGLIDGDLVIYYCTTANILTITANTGQTIRHGAGISSTGGTCVSTAIGDSITLRFDATAVSWRSVGSIGLWTTT